MTALEQLLQTFRSSAKTEHGKGTYFEELVKAHLLPARYVTPQRVSDRLTGADV